MPAHLIPLLLYIYNTQFGGVRDLSAFGRDVRDVCDQLAAGLTHTQLARGFVAPFWLSSRRFVVVALILPQSPIPSVDLLVFYFQCASGENIALVSFIE